MAAVLIIAVLLALAVGWGLLRQKFWGGVNRRLNSRFGYVTFQVHKGTRKRPTTQLRPEDINVNSSPEEALDVWYATATDAGLTITEEDTDVARDGLIARVKVEGVWYDLLWSRGVVNAVHTVQS